MRQCRDCALGAVTQVTNCAATLRADDIVQIGCMFQTSQTMSACQMRSLPESQLCHSTVVVQCMHSRQDLTSGCFLHCTAILTEADIIPFARSMQLCVVCTVYGWDNLLTSACPVLHRNLQVTWLGLRCGPPCRSAAVGSSPRAWQRTNAVM